MIKLVVIAMSLATIPLLVASQARWSAGTTDLATGTVVAQPSATPTSNAIADQVPTNPIERGGFLYVSQGCNVCHGEQGEGDVGPALAGTSLTLGEVRRQLRNPRGFMPAYIEEILSDEQIRDLYAFERSLGSP